MSDTTQTAANQKVYSKEALNELVAQNPDQYYISIHENVYDVTEFLDEVRVTDLKISNLGSHKIKTLFFNILNFFLFNKIF